MKQKSDVRALSTYFKAIFNYNS